MIRQKTLEIEQTKVEATSKIQLELGRQLEKAVVSHKNHVSQIQCITSVNAKLTCKLSVK